MLHVKFALIAYLKEYTISRFHVTSHHFWLLNLDTTQDSIIYASTSHMKNTAAEEKLSVCPDVSTSLPPFENAKRPRVRPRCLA